MRELKKKIFVFGLMTIFAYFSSYANEKETLLLRSPTVSEKNVAFIYGGDIWVADRSGANPRRLTINSAEESNPVFSPDGKQIAFTGNYDGNSDVYIISVEGGSPKRITYHPESDNLIGWLSNDELYFKSKREFTYSLNPRMFKIKTDGTGETPLPMPEAVYGSPSNDHRYWAYIKDNDFTESSSTAFKLYRGGGMPKIWIFDTHTNDIVTIPAAGSNNIKPQWVEDKIYFLSDRDKTMNIYSYDIKNNNLQQLTHFDNYDINSLTSSDKVLTFEQAGKIHLLDLITNKITDISVHIQADQPNSRPHYVDMAEAIHNFNISPTGARALFESRGEIFSVPKMNGSARNISNSPGSHEKYPSWSPDGKYISYLSDKKGVYQLVLQNQVTKAEPEYITLGNTHFYFEPVWSPDSRKLFYSDAHLNLYYIDIESRKRVLIKADKLSSNTYRVNNQFSPSWSPDSKWIAYQATLPNRFTGIFLYNLETGTHSQVTDGMSDVNRPIFSKDGKYLFFLASTDVGLTGSSLNMSSFGHSANYKAYALVLSKSTPSPYKIESDEETVKADEPKTTKREKDKPSKGKKAKEKMDTLISVKIDLEDLKTRIVALPISASDNLSLCGDVEGKLLYKLQNELSELDLNTMKSSLLTGNIGDFVVSNDGKTMLYSSEEMYYMVPAGKKLNMPGEGKLNLKGIKLLVDPQAEWKQIFNEVWNLDNELFYVENMHGVNWPAVKVKYEKFLPYISQRQDLNYLLRQMMGDLCVGHHYIWSDGDLPNPVFVGTGMLGADYETDQGFYRIRKIFKRLNWNPDFNAPLDRPGLDIKEGDYILAVNGVPVTDNGASIYSFFTNKVGNQITLKVNNRPSFEGAREIVVIPTDSRSEFILRYMDWVERNRQRVDQMSNGQIAYIYMPDTGNEGYKLFNRYYFSQLDKKALIIDDRNNGGGKVADYVIDLLKPKLTSYWGIRDGTSFTTPDHSIIGPKAMVINQNAGSGGDAMPYLFKNEGLGKLVGHTTMGILVGISTYPKLIDDAEIKVPSFGIYDGDGKWIIENEGVKPDIAVEQTPKDLLEGKDPQLDRTIKLLQEEMITYPYPKVIKPTDPIRGKSN